MRRDRSQARSASDGRQLVRFLQFLFGPIGNSKGLSVLCNDIQNIVVARKALLQHSDHCRRTVGVIEFAVRSDQDFARTDSNLAGGLAVLENVIEDVNRLRGRSNATYDSPKRITISGVKSPVAIFFISRRTVS